MRDKKKIYIIMKKNVEFNSRVQKQALTLAQAGYDVTVIAVKVKGQKSYEQRDRYTIIRLQLEPLHVRIRRIYPIMKGLLLDKIFRLKKIQSTPETQKQKSASSLMSDTIRIGNHLSSSDNSQIELGGLASYNSDIKHFSEILQGHSYAIPPNERINDKTFFFKCLKWSYIKGKKYLKWILKNAFRLVFFLPNIIANFLSKFLHPLEALDLTWKCWNLLKDQRGHLYHAHDSYGLPVAYWLARRHKAVLVYDAVEIITDRNVVKKKRFFSWIAYRLEKHLTCRCDLVMTVAPTKAKLLSERYNIASPLVLMHCCPYQPSPKPLQWDFLDQLNHSTQKIDLYGKKVGLYSGAITHNRGLEQLIQSIFYLSEDIIIIIMGPIGASRYLEKLKSLITENNVEDRVIIFPPVPQSQVINYTSSAHISIVPIQYTLSHYLSLPNKIFEAIMARVPVAASNFPAMREIILGNQIGGVFDQTDPMDIARCINELMDPEVYKRLLPKLEQASSKYHWESEAKKMANAYKLLLSKHNCN